jgi:asparagine synthase (glutamine-hydrolysing)
MVVGLRMAAAIEHRAMRAQIPTCYSDANLMMISVGRPLGRAQRDGRCVAGWDGYLTNAPQLRQRALAHGGSWPADDSELIATLCAAHGSRTPDRLRGGFALAAWHRGEQRPLPPRDPAGIKPLCWAQTTDYFLFASEAKALLASGLISRELDVTSLEDLFTWWFPFPPRTMFRGISTLLPGHRLELRDRAVRGPERYFRAPFPGRGATGPRDIGEIQSELIDRLRAGVSSSVKAGERSAVYLSSGLDSALIGSLFGSTLGRAPLTLTVGSRESDFDERGLAGLMNEKLRARSLRLLFQDDPVARFEDAVWHAELPPVAPTLGSAWAAASRLHREGIEVVLTGDGADELFGGHEWHRTERLRHFFDRAGLRWLWPLLVRRAAGSAGADRGAADFLLRITREPAGEVRSRFRGLYPPWYASWHALDLHRGPLLSPEGGAGRAVRAPGAPPAGFFDVVRDDLAEMHALDAALSIEFETKLPSWNLVFVERGAASKGLDVRLPFLDRDFIEFAAALPTSMKMRLLREKAVLRRAATGHVPEAIRTRPKRTPPRQFAAGLFDRRHLQQVQHHLGRESVESAGVFSARTVQTLLDEHRTAPAGEFRRFRLESVLTLVLGVQLLHDRFIRRLDVPAVPAGAPPELHGGLGG